MRHLLPAFLLVFLSFPCLAATKTWTGSGTDANWQTAGNWMNNSVPVSGDDLVSVVDQHGVGEAKPTDSGSDLVDLLLRMGPGIGRAGFE